MLQQELRHNGKIWSENIILIHIHSNLSPGFILTTQRWVDIEQIIMPAHELQLTYGRRVNPIQHFPIYQGSTVTSQGTNHRKKRSQ